MKILIILIALTTFSSFAYAKNWNILTKVKYRACKDIYPQINDCATFFNNIAAKDINFKQNATRIELLLTEKRYFPRDECEKILTDIEKLFAEYRKVHCGYVQMINLCEAQKDRSYVSNVVFLQLALGLNSLYYQDYIKKCHNP